MIKKIGLFVTVIVAMSVWSAGIALAAPEKLTGDERSTAKLVQLSKPEGDFSTFSDSCIVSGKSEQGVKVTVYIKNGSEGTYEKLTVDGEKVSWTVGVSGIFAKEIGLERNKTNKILFYAEKDKDFQIIKRSITVKDKNLKEVLKNEVVKIEDLITKILSN